MPSPHRAIIALLLALALPGCGRAGGRQTSGDAVGDTDAPPPLAGTEWVALSVDGARVLAGTQITLEADSLGLGGYAGCNWYGGRYTRRGDSLRVEDVSSTGRGCLVPQGVTEQEMRFLTLLREARSYRISGDTLRLQGAGGQGILAFRRRPPLAMDPAALVGTRWRLETLGGRAMADRRITLAFERDSVRGFAGCRDYVGTYRAERDRIAFTSTTMLEMECPDRALLELEGGFTTGLGESHRWRLAPGRLELFTPGGDTLAFTAAP